MKMDFEGGGGFQPSLSYVCCHIALFQIPKDLCISKLKVLTAAATRFFIIILSPGQNFGGLQLERNVTFGTYSS
jgi:hypothetical protein